MFRLRSFRSAAADGFSHARIRRDVFHAVVIHDPQVAAAERVRHGPGHFRFGEHTDGCGYDCLDGQRANYLDSDDPYECGDYPWTTPVGFYNGELHYKVDFGWPCSATSYQTQNAQSYYACYDMCGNVWEMCEGVWIESMPLMKGGCFLGKATFVRGSARWSPEDPDNGAHWLGFRCIKEIPGSPPYDA